MSTDGHATEHTMTRLEIPTGKGFAEFRSAFERAVPGFDRAAVLCLGETGATWDDVKAAVAAQAPHDFVLFTTFDTTTLMAMAGHQRPCVEYLMGNHTIAERMFRHHPATLLYAPLRVLLYSDDDGRAVFAIDQPSTVFDGFGHPAITEVGRELDDKVAALLDHLGVDVARYWPTRA
ncbi:DUF302 domain-containing protein [Saccharopolyspora sp. 5N708]|uniref:DUF302 domain-containing protein n=1 Tax=Saccharopolyspora sp. 5N708 TaxID=3457424 RepID=UPI003FD2A3C2